MTKMRLLLLIIAFLIILALIPKIVTPKDLIAIDYVKFNEEWYKAFPDIVIFCFGFYILNFLIEPLKKEQSIKEILDHNKLLKKVFLHSKENLIRILDEIIVNGINNPAILSQFLDGLKTCNESLIEISRWIKLIKTKNPIDELDLCFPIGAKESLKIINLLIEKIIQGNIAIYTPNTEFASELQNLKITLATIPW